MPLPAPVTTATLSVSCSIGAWWQTTHAGCEDAAMARVDDLLSALTLDEKAAVVAGVDLWHTAAVERLGIPALKVSDGPSGVRGEQWSGRASASFPCGTAFGATWNPELVHEVGAAARRRGAPQGRARDPRPDDEHPSSSARGSQLRVLLRRSVSVGANGDRRTSPACSRVASGVRVKHFVANDSEYERMTISSEVDDRTLREISLVPFEAAVLEAGTLSVMTAYNRLNGTYCSEHRWLLTDLLKGEWAFDGVAMSDWFGTHSTAPAANAGLDLEMPGPPQWFGSKLADAVRAGEVDVSTVDDKVRRVLALLERVGALDDPTPHPEESIDDPQDRAVARQVAAESFVLLQHRADLLPLRGARSPGRHRPERRRRATSRAAAARASIRTRRSRRSPGCTSRFADREIVHERGCSSFKRTPVLDDRMLDGPLRVAYHGGRERAGDEFRVDEASRGYFTFMGPLGGGAPDEFSLRVTGTVVAPESGEWTFTLVQVGRARAEGRRRRRRGQLGSRGPQRRVHGVRQLRARGHRRARGR